MHTVKQRALSLSAAAALTLTLAACGSNTAQAGSESSGGEEQDLVLSQDQVTLDGQVLSEGEDGAVTLSHDIVYYQEGQGSDYGEGTAQEEHSAGEADAGRAGPVSQQLVHMRQVAEYDPLIYRAQHMPAVVKAGQADKGPLGQRVLVGPVQKRQENPNGHLNLWPDMLLITLHHSARPRCRL